MFNPNVSRRDYTNSTVDASQVEPRQREAEFDRSAGKPELQTSEIAKVL